MQRILDKFEVRHLQILDENSNCDEKLISIDQETIKKMYESMILARAFDDKAFKLQRQGRLNTYAPLRGQEATQIGAAFAIEKEDWLFPLYRDNGMMVAKGMPIHLLIQYWAGDSRGLRIPDNLNIFTLSIPVGTQILHAVGSAWAMKLLKHKAASIVFFGDGATSTGDFHAGMNWAGVFHLPVVLVCENNQWAISLPVEQQTASETIAQKAIAYGFEGLQVDGNDVFAVYKAVKDALDKARKGDGPTFIECLTYRISDHTTSDDASRYRPSEQMDEWKKKDPVERLEKYMRSKNILNDQYKNEVLKKAEDLIESGVRMAESIPAPEAGQIFENLYEKMPKNIIEQMKKLKENMV